MVTLAAIAILAQSQSYFPLASGLTWEYTVSIKDSAMRARQVQKVLEPIEISGVRAFPMKVWVNDKEDATVYYAERDGYISLVALNDKETLPKPIPVLPIEPRKGDSWKFQGETRMLGTPVGTTIKSRVAGTEKIDVLGSEREAVKVIVEAKIGSGELSFNTRTTEFYCKGIGLVQRKQEMLAKDGAVAQYALVRFEEGR